MINYFMRKGRRDGVGVITLRVRHGGLDFKLSTDITIPEADWSTDMCIVRRFTSTRPEPQLDGLSYSELFKRMASLKQLLESMEPDELTKDNVRRIMYNELHPDHKKQRGVAKEKLKPTFMEFIESYIKECETGVRLNPRTNKPLSYETTEGYYIFLGHMRKYEQRHHCRLDWDDLTLSWFFKWKKDMFSLDHYSINYVAHETTMLKRFLHAASDMHYTTCKDYELSEFRSSWEEVDNVYLTKDMLTELYNMDFTDVAAIRRNTLSYTKEEKAKVDELLSNAQHLGVLNSSKDLFIVGCLTGQRVSDYKRMQTSMMVKLSDGRRYMHLEQKKTKKEVYIPLDEKVIDIFSKYKGGVPKMSSGALNYKLKDIGLLMGWNHLTGIRDRKTGREKKYYECIVTHTARRTFATLAYEKKISASAIMTITGHKTEASFRKYIKTSVQDKAILAAQEFFEGKVLSI